MIALFIGLTLLLMSFLSALDALGWDLAARAGAYRWVPAMVLAALVVGVFMRASRLQRRLLYPRRGMRLLSAGIALYALGVAAATGSLAHAATLIPIEAGSHVSRAPELLASLLPQPIFLVAQLLLVIGAFRALSNLVSPSEFEADY